MRPTGSAVESASGQVLTTSSGPLIKKAAVSEQLIGRGGVSGDMRPTILVRSLSGEMPLLPPAKGTDRPLIRPCSSKARRGGWRTVPALSWQDVKDVHAVAYHAGYNTVLHIMPTKGSPQERKRRVANIVAHLGQELRRRGRSHIGTTVYERSASADIHGHHIVRIERADIDLLSRYDGVEVFVSSFPHAELSKVVGYVTKQRVPLPPDFERKLTHLRQRGLPIRGTRVSHTRAARELLLDIEDRKFWR